MRRLTRNAGLLLGGKAANAVLGLAVLAVAARALGAEGLGMLVLLHGLAQVVAELAKFQSWQGIVRFGAGPLAEGRDEVLMRLLSFALLLDFAVGAAGTAFAVLAGPSVARALGWPEPVADLAAPYGFAVAFMVVGTPSGILRLLGRFDLVALQSTVANGVRLAGGAAAWALGGGLEAFALVWWLAALAAGLVPFPLAARALAARGHAVRAVRPSGVRKAHPGLWRFFALTSANAVVQLAPGVLAALVVGSVLGPAAAGLFKVARQFADAASKPAEFLAQALYPEAARMDAGGERAPLARVLARLALAVTGLAALVVLALAGLGEWALRLAAGAEFASAYPVLAALAVAAAFTTLAAPAEPALIATGRAGRVVAAKAVAQALHLALLIPLLHVLGLVGAGAAAAIAGMVTLIPLWVAAARLPRDG